MILGFRVLLDCRPQAPKFQEPSLPASDSYSTWYQGPLLRVNPYLEDPLVHKFVLDSCFDTLVVPLSAFSDTCAFWNVRPGFAKKARAQFVRNSSAIFHNLSANFRNRVQFQKCAFLVFSVRALFNNLSGISCVHKFVYQLVPTIGIQGKAKGLRDKVQAKPPGV